MDDLRETLEREHAGAERLLSRRREDSGRRASRTFWTSFRVSRDWLE